MHTFEIFVDSSANLTEELIKEHNVGVVSYTCSLDNVQMECYKQGQDNVALAKTFYTAMANGAKTSTSLVNADKIITAVEPTIKEGKDVLFICIAKNISGTYAQAIEASKILKENYPNNKMVVVETSNASLGQGLFAVYASHLRDMGQSIEDCAEWIDNHKFKMHSIVTVGDLKYLRRGGRISTAVAIAGALLNIKPIIWASSAGKMELATKVRGKKKALLHLFETFKEHARDIENQIIGITHANAEEDALALAQMLRDYGAKKIVINYYDICTGAHIGPGTVALFYMSNTERSEVENKNGLVFEADPAPVFFKRSTPSKA